MKNFLKTMGIKNLFLVFIPTSSKSIHVFHTYYQEYSTVYKKSISLFSLTMEDFFGLSTYKHP